MAIIPIALTSISKLKAHLQKQLQQNNSLNSANNNPNPYVQTQNSEHRQAAVLLLIYPGYEGLEIILTKRSMNLPHHAGQISLPGGSVEAEDKDTTHTALREAEEEIGLSSSKVDIVGSMNQVILPSGFAVTPVVGVMDKAQKLQADPGEVEEIFTIPLSLILNSTLYKRDSYIRNGVKREFYFFDYKEYYVWGATAGILQTFGTMLSGSN